MVTPSKTTTVESRVHPLDAYRVRKVAGRVPGLVLGDGTLTAAQLDEGARHLGAAAAACR